MTKLDDLFLAGACRLIQTFLRPLRVRLTLWNTVVVLVACLLALLGVREAMRLTLFNETRQLLREEVLELELATQQLYPQQQQINEEFQRKVLGHSEHLWFAALLKEQKIIFQSEQFPEDAHLDQVLGDAHGTVTFEQSSQWIMARHWIEVGDGTRFQILLGEPTEFIRNDVWQLTKVMLAIGIGLIIVAPVGGYLLARRATSPVREIVATAKRLEPTRLESRLPIRGTGDELDQISTEINSFVDQISRYITSQREFVANAAHELRSPITAIQTSVDVTLDKRRTPEEYEEELKTVSEQCQQLRYLVNQLLELAESDAQGRRTPQNQIDVGNLIERSINVFTGVAEEKRVELQYNLEPNVTLLADESQIRQVVNNLLDNSLKFSPPNSQVTVRLSVDNQDILISVKDSGPGVPEPLLDRIFDRFFQVDAARQRTAGRGNGLGLAICRSIVHQYGGSISAQNTGRGLCVTVKLPKLDTGS